MVRSLLDDVEGIERQDLIASARRRRFAKREHLFHEGDPGASLHVIVKGYIAIRSVSELGDTVTLTVLGPGQVFGELALLSEESERTASAVALERVETLSWNRDQFDALRKASPGFDQFLIEVLGEQVRRLSSLLVEALHVPADKRVLRRLCSLALLRGGDEPAVVVPVTQEDLASLAGTTRPTANRVLKDAESNGLLELSRGRIVVADLAGLEDTAFRSR